MSYFSSRDQFDAEPSRADIILVRKGERETERPRNLLHVIVPRSVPRRTHQRLEERAFVTDLTATIRCGDEAVELPVVNLSSNGLMIAVKGKLFPRIGESVDVAIAQSDPVPMAFRWSNGARAGLELASETTIDCGFHDAIGPGDCAEGEGRSEQRGPGERRSLIFLCQIALGEEMIVARLRNISRRGAMLSLAERRDIAPGTGLALSFEKAGRFGGHVRWQSEDLVGVALDEDFPLEIFETEPHLAMEPVSAPPAPQPASREDSLRIRYTGLGDPTRAPDLEYKPLTLKELYYTLYEGYNPARKL